MRQYLRPEFLRPCFFYFLFLLTEIHSLLRFTHFYLLAFLNSKILIEDAARHVIVKSL